MIRVFIVSIAIVAGTQFAFAQSKNYIEMTPDRLAKHIDTLRQGLDTAKAKNLPIRVMNGAVEGCPIVDGVVCCGPVGSCKPGK